MNSGFSRSVLPPSSSSGYATDSDVFDEDHLPSHNNSQYSHYTPAISHSNVVDWARSVHLEASTVSARSQARMKEFEMHTQNFIQLVSTWTESQASREENLQSWQDRVLVPR